MNNNILKRALVRLHELYGENPPILILDRFYKESALLKSSKLPLFLEATSLLKEKAKNDGEHIFVRGSTPCSFISFLLGATEINPLPSHKYCPKCKRVTFTSSQLFPLDEHEAELCECGFPLHLDGYGLNFEMCYSNIGYPLVEIAVSPSYLKDSIALVSSHLKKSEGVKTTGDEACPFVRILITNEKCQSLSANELSLLPHVTLAKLDVLEKFKELEKATGVSFDTIKPSDKILLQFLNGITHNDNRFFGELLLKAKPKSYKELLTLIGFCHGTHVWKDNIEELFENKSLPICEYPAFRDDLYDMISKRLQEKGYHSGGIAYEIARRGSFGYYYNNGMIESQKRILIELGFDMDFISFLEKVIYMSPKAHGICDLLHAISLMWYKINYPNVYDKLFF